jgi:hypothetical protein
MAGSDLREARADVASAAALGGAAKQATVASMGSRTEAAVSWRQQAEPSHAACGAGKRASRGCQIWLRWPERMTGEGDQAAGGASSAPVAMSSLVGWWSSRAVSCLLL